MNIYYGFNAPFLGGSGGVLSRQVDEKLIRNDLLQLLLTSPGERVMRPTFGTGIRTFVFENITDQSINDLQSNIMDAIAANEPRVTATQVTINPIEDDNFVSIKVYGKFVLDRYHDSQTAQARDAGLLIEYNLPLNKLKQTSGNGVVAS
jgi:hypothetical protein